MDENLGIDYIENCFIKYFKLKKFDTAQGYFNLIKKMKRGIKGDEIIIQNSIKHSFKKRDYDKIDFLINNCLMYYNLDLIYNLYKNKEIGVEIIKYIIEAECFDFLDILKKGLEYNDLEFVKFSFYDNVKFPLWYDKEGYIK